MKQVVDNLKAARKLISKKKNWTQRAFARGKTGRVVNELGPAAVCFCAMGAVIRTNAADLTYSATVLALDNAIPSECCVYDVVEFNDTRTHKEVLALFDRAI